MVRTATLTSYLQVAEELGLNPQAELSAVGLSLALLATPDKPIPFSAALALLERSAQHSQCNTLGLRMAERRKVADFGASSLLLTHQRNARDAILMSIQYRHLLNDALLLAMEEQGPLTRVREEFLTDGAQPAVQAVELGVAMVVMTVQAVTGFHWRPQSVHFTHSAPDNLDVHQRVFKCRLEFNSGFNGFTCPTSDLLQENPAADPTMAAYARAYVETLPGHNSGSVATDVKQVVYLLLPMGRASIKQVAQVLGRNVRTLQRELDDSGASFTDILNQARRELALRYLDSRRTDIGQIAGLLGYARPAAFTRWFSQQFGMAPLQWRKQRPGGKAAAATALPSEPGGVPGPH
jgi:AraC-like DNA-binding protein